MTTESQKTYDSKILSGFFKKYMSGNGLDIGYKGNEHQKGQPILSTAIGIDLDYPKYDGIHLPFESSSQDYAYSSHALEHISNYQSAIKEWYRVVKRGGFIITVVPHRDLYEKKLFLPSRFNPDHKRLYTPASFLKEFEDSLPINSFRVRHMKDNDEGHDYTQSSQEHSLWLYEIELVIQKIGQ